jgi:biotin-dependent carboxylase-like uncharacterized protein
MQHLGVVPSGCMDLQSFSIANRLVGNNLTEGVIEFAYQGPLLKLIKGKTKIAITGNVFFKIIKNNSKILEGECNRSYNLNEGDQIDILATKESVYGYLAIEGGFDLEIFWNSISTLSRANIGPNSGMKIKINDKIVFNKLLKNIKNFATEIVEKKNNVIRVLKGSQFNYFSEKSKRDFFLNEYKITNLTDRMGMRLEGMIIENIVNTNIKSEGIIKGSIQVPADGQPIVLLTDHPTIGGYPKIANVISADYDLLVQKIPGNKFCFQNVELHEAEQLYRDHQNNISQIIKNIKEIN